MPRKKAPKINELKASAGFPADSAGERLYRTWREATKDEMKSRRILSSTDPGRAQWAELTRWVLTKVPFSERAMLHGETSAAGREFTQAVHGLLCDVVKKLNHTRRRQVDLNPPPQPDSPMQGSFSFPSIYCFTELTWIR